jgi:hypothetical protein
MPRPDTHPGAEHAADKWNSHADKVIEKFAFGPAEPGPNGPPEDLPNLPKDHFSPTTHPGLPEAAIAHADLSSHLPDHVADFLL